MDASSSTPAAPDLTPQLQALTAGLLFLSESEAPLEVIRCALPAGPLPNAALLQVLGEPAETPIHTVSLAYFLRNHTAATGTGDALVAARYQALQAFMEQQLLAVQVYRVGTEPRLTVYALGEVGADQLIGFKTVLIET